MKSRAWKPLTAIAMAALLLTPLIGWAQTASNFRVVKIADQIYELTATYPFETNIIASVGPDGILLVDTGTKYTMQELKTVLDTLGGPVRIIINTHAHAEHSAGTKPSAKR